MKQEDKELLLKDLCSRLPYEVKVYIKNWSKLDRKYYEGVYTVESVHPSLNNIYASTENASVEVILGYADYVIKPYLFPLSSMTEEQKKEISKRYNYYNPYQLCVLITNHRQGCWDNDDNSCDLRDYLWLEDWFNKNHFDYRGLIPMGLALDATDKNIYNH